MLSRMKDWARTLKQEVLALVFAYRDPRTPWYAKLLAGFVAAHTLSPIDLIPDFIPILGYLDDLIITPLGLALAVKLIPPEVLADARIQAQEGSSDLSMLSKVGLGMVLAVWLAAAALVVKALVAWFRAGA